MTETFYKMAVVPMIQYAGHSQLLSQADFPAQFVEEMDTYERVRYDSESCKEEMHQYRKLQEILLDRGLRKLYKLVEVLLPTDFYNWCKCPFKMKVICVFKNKQTIAKHMQYS